LREQVDFFNRTYQAATGNYDIYALFVEKALNLIRENGIHGFIMPHKFFQSSYGEGLRKLISESNTLAEIANFRDNQIYEGASTYTCLLFLAKNKAQKFRYAEVKELLNPVEHLHNLIAHESFSNGSMQAEYVSKAQASSAPWNFHFESAGGLIEKIRRNTKTLEDVTDRIFQGLKTSADKIYILNVVKRKKNSLTVHSVIKQLPVCSIYLDSSSDKVKHDKMGALVDQMLTLNKRLPEVKTEHEKTALERQIEVTDRQIDQLVYELYGLTEEEIKIVERKGE
jgi:Eco57I restriction-modification methylase